MSPTRQLEINILNHVYAFHGAAHHGMVRLYAESKKDELLDMNTNLAEMTKGLEKWFPENWLEGLNDICAELAATEATPGESAKVQLGSWSCGLKTALQQMIDSIRELERKLTS